MALTLDPATRVISIPQGDLTLISGTLYEIDTDVFRKDLFDLLASEAYIWLPDAFVHNTEVTVAGTTFARTLEMINGFSVEFTPNSQWTVLLSGSNNNLFDVENGILTQNQVQVVSQNSGGLIRAVNEADVWNYNPNDGLTTYEMLHRIEHMRAEMYVDTDLIPVGEGTQAEPYNNITDAIDHAEAWNVKRLIIYSDITIDRQLKNFIIEGIGTPTVNTNGQNLDKTEFLHCSMEGDYTGVITVQECVLLNGFTLNGYFETCGLAGDLVCADGSNVLLTQCVSVIPGLGRPTISMNAAGTCALSVRKNGGGMTIYDCNQPTDTVTVESSEGSVTFDSTCTNGNMVVRGNCKFVDETAGATVTDESMPELTWRHTWALSVAKYLGLK